MIANNYPPLSFYVIGSLGRIFGDNLFVGRAVSIVALLCLSAEIFLAVRILPVIVTWTMRLHREENFSAGDSA